MPMGDRGWTDRIENYADGYNIDINGSTATGVHATDLKQPFVVYSVTLSCNPAVGSGEVALVDGSATGDSGDKRKHRIRVASAASQIFTHTINFPRGLVFDVGLIVSAATVSGSVGLTYKMRYE